ncbi:MAG: glycosyltransferase family 39 protein [Ignavibacteria bacterium]|nr:glycosyltransferase family 39 protein [Ignavibacteria bacterium]
MLGDRTLTYDRFLPMMLCIFGLLLFSPFLGSVHLFDWDEINFAEAAREMILTGDYLRVHIDYQPFWEKPPLFLWMQALSMQIFGINEFAARFPNALCGALALPLLFLLGKELHGRTIGLLWSIMYAGSFLPHFYFKSGIIDPWFNLLIILGVLIPALPAIKQRFMLSALMSGTCIGLAILTKGPVALIISSGTFFILAGIDIVKTKHVSELLSRMRWIALMSCYSMLMASLWFGLEIAQHGTWFMEEFIRYQIRLFSTGDAGHSGPFYYHAIILLIGCFPASAFALKKLFDRNSVSLDIRLMMIVFWLTLILFSIVKTKIIHYSSLCYLPLTYMSAFGLRELLTTQKIGRVLNIGLLCGLLFWTIALLAIPLIGLNLQSILPLIKDEFARMNLTAPVYWSGYELGIGIIYFIIGITGWFFLQKQTMMKKGIVFLACSTMIALLTFLPIIAPKIEGYTQASPIAFYQGMQGKDVLLYPSGFKSYAHLFYSRKLPPKEFPEYTKLTDEELMNGASKKPVFFVAKIKRAQELLHDPRVKPIAELHGFTLFRVQSTNVSRQR